MEDRTMVCILCPVGCQLHVCADGNDVTVTGNLCLRGKDYGKQELLMPMRMVTATVRVIGGRKRWCPVKTASMVPKASVPAVLNVIRSVEVASPMRLGAIACKNIASTGVDLVTTAETQ